MIELGIVNKSENSLPEYKTIGSSGMDIMAAFLPDRGEILKPGQRMLIHTGLYFEIPEDYEIQVRSRSGLSLKRGLIVLNEPATIDASKIGYFRIKHL